MTAVATYEYIILHFANSCNHCHCISSGYPPLMIISCLVVLFVYFLKVVKKPPRNWKDLKCQKILKCGGWCQGFATKGNRIAVSVPNCIKVYDRSSTDLLHTIGEDQLGLYLPGVTFYDQEHILVSDYDNDNIKMFTIQGRHVRTIDRGSTSFKPEGISISPDGHIYVCDVPNDCVCVFDVCGRFLFSFGSFGSGDECFNSPVDLCFASDGFLYITDFGNSRICVYDKNGKLIRNLITMYEPRSIDATDCGQLIVSSYESDEVAVYTTGGDLVHVFGEYGSEFGQFDHPFGVSVDSDGLIYIADSCNHRIEMF